MKGKVIAMCGIVVVLGIISAGAGFVAEVTRVKLSDVRIEHLSCVYPSSPALGLGIVAAVFAIITRIVLLILVGCCCCCRPRGSTSTAIPIIFDILSWIASVVAMILLFGGAALNNREGEQTDSQGRISCYAVKPGIFATGAVLLLLSAIFGIVAYVLLSSVKQMAPQLEFALPVAANVDPEKNIPLPPQQ
ncbi:protein MODIFYING WALL LIGNIN-1-like [Bidens hawaiensis]|uniref:protein MODIFYING WALL LIGNIN-1-like n=1 Tax=Bidens hawaiensis TaxID=980011 RepID=UPI004049FED6